MPFIEEGEVLVNVSMTSIYQLAAEKFGISVDSITDASYQDLPKEVEERIQAERSAQRSGGA